MLLSPLGFPARLAVDHRPETSHLPLAKRIYSAPYGRTTDVVNKIREIRESYPTPEHINNSPETAPSKRLEKLIPNYAKIKNGTLISKDMGIDKILAECPHFREWIEQISRLGA